MIGGVHSFETNSFGSAIAARWCSVPNNAIT